MKAHKGPTAKFNLSTVEDPELKQKLEMQYIQFESLRRINVEAQRAAIRAQSNAVRAMAEVQLAQLDFLIQAGEAFDLINSEPVWMTRRANNGDVILECLITEQDMQRMAKAQTKQMKDNINEISPEEDDDESDNGMFTEK